MQRVQIICYESISHTSSFSQYATGGSEYVFRSSGISQKLGALIVRYSQKKEWISIVFYCSENPSITHYLGTTGLIQVEFSANCTSPNEHFNKIGNWKCHIIQVPTDFPRSHHICCIMTNTSTKVVHLHLYNVCNMPQRNHRFQFRDWICIPKE